MTPAELHRLAGQLHHLPDARDLRIVDADGTAHELPWQAVEVYEAVPALIETAQNYRSACEVATGLHNDKAAIRDALGLPADAPWADVLERARLLRRLGERHAAMAVIEAAFNDEGDGGHG